MVELSEFGKNHRQWLIDNGLENLDEVNPFEGKSYRSMIFEFNLTHPDNKILIKEE